MSNNAPQGTEQVRARTQSHFWFKRPKTSRNRILITSSYLLLIPPQMNSLFIPKWMLLHTLDSRNFPILDCCFVYAYWWNYAQYLFQALLVCVPCGVWLHIGLHFCVHIHREGNSFILSHNYMYIHTTGFIAWISCALSHVWFKNANWNWIIYNIIVINT